MTEFEEWAKENKDIIAGSKNIISDLITTVVSLVANPAVQDSKHVIFKHFCKSAKHTKMMNMTGQFLRKADSNTFFAAVLIPDRVDLQGDIVPPYAVEKAANDFLKNYREIDNEHNLKTGVAKVVQSWTLKSDEVWENTQGYSLQYNKGTWFMGVEPNEEMADKIAKGEITGFSIYGMGESIESSSLLDEEMMKMEKKNEEVVIDYDKLGAIIAKSIVDAKLLDEVRKDTREKSEIKAKSVVEEVLDGKIGLLVNKSLSAIIAERKTDNELKLTITRGRYNE